MSMRDFYEIEEENSSREQTLTVQSASGVMPDEEDGMEFEEEEKGEHKWRRGSGIGYEEGGDIG